MKDIFRKMISKLLRGEYIDWEEEFIQVEKDIKRKILKKLPKLETPYSSGNMDYNKLAWKEYNGFSNCLTQCKKIIEEL